MLIKAQFGGKNGFLVFLLRFRRNIEFKKTVIISKNGEYLYTECKITRPFIWDRSHLWTCDIDDSFPKKRKYWCIDFTDCTSSRSGLLAFILSYWNPLFTYIIFFIFRYIAVSHPHYYREVNARITPIRRVLCYAVPVTTFSILVNIPKFLETEVRTTYYYILKCIQGEAVKLAPLYYN